MTEQANYYAIIPADIRYDNRLTDSEKLLYGEITCLTKKTGECFASNKYFAELYEVSVVTISTRIKHLKDFGYLEIHMEYKEGTKEILRRYIRILKGGIKEILNTPIKANLKDNNTSINNTSNREQEAKASLLSLKKEREQKIYTILEVFKEFDYEIKLWGGRRQNREAAEILYDVKGVDKVRNILFFFKNQYKGTTTIGNTYDLLQKYDVIKKEYAK